MARKKGACAALAGHHNYVGQAVPIDVCRSLKRVATPSHWLAMSLGTLDLILLPRVRVDCFVE